MNNRILATLFALVLIVAMFIGVAPVEAEAACAHKTVKNCECTSCGAAVHKLEWKSDSQKHYQECSVCKKHFNEGTHQDVAYSATSDDTQHTAMCRTCGYTETQDHTRRSNECRCEKCLQIMDHDLKWYTTGGEHWEECETCDYATTKEAHTWTAVAAENGQHVKTCSVCEKEVTEACADVNTDKDCLCDLCKAPMIATEHKLKNVAAVAKTCTTDGTFTYNQCEYCGKMFSTVNGRELTAEDIVDEAEGHDESVTWFKDEESHWHVCKNDGCEVEKLSEASHIFEWKTDATTHWQECSVCKYIPKAYTPVGEDHDFEYVSNGDGTHSKKCKTCGYEVEKLVCSEGTEVDCLCQHCGELLKHEIGPLRTVEKQKAYCLEDGYEKHYKCPTCENIFKYEGGECILTNAEEIKIPATGHELVWNHNNEGHWQACTNRAHGKTCSYKTELVPHDASAYTYIEGEYKHSLDCETCGRGSSAYYLDCIDENEDCLCDQCGGLMKHERTDLEYHAYVKATCTADGHLDYFTCKHGCGVIFRGSASDGYDPYTEDVVLKAPGHNWEHRQTTLSGNHVVKCTACNAYETIGHTDKDGDCLCDLGTCDMPVHSHKSVYVSTVEPTCDEPGVEGYYYFEGCGRMFMDDVEIDAPVEIPATGHKLGTKVEAIDNDTHGLKCTVCGKFEQAVAHADTNGDNRCDGCGVELALEAHAEVPATCSANGKKAYWYSPVTGRSYYDAAGTQLVTDVNDLVIPKINHLWGVWSSNGQGGHVHTCTTCGASETEAHSNQIVACVCDICGDEISGHNVTLVNAVVPTCTKAGYESYIKCSCGNMFSASTGKAISEPVMVKATGHNMSTKVKEDVRQGNHYIECLDCDYRLYEDHVMAVEDPMRGNYHQWVCACGEIETAMHSDSDGDKLCDDCGHDMGQTQTTVTQHDNKTVVTGEAETIQPTKNWFTNWLNNLVPGNAGAGATASSNANTQVSSSSNTTVKADKDAVVEESTNNVSNNTNTNTGSSAESGSTGTVTETETTGIINQIIQFLSQLFNSLLG